MKRYKCESCMEAVELVQISHPKTGESDKEEIWLMCNCKGFKIGEPDEMNYPKVWKGSKIRGEYETYRR